MDQKSKNSLRESARIPERMRMSETKLRRHLTLTAEVRPEVVNLKIV
jgi:hypothetical protein